MRKYLLLLDVKFWRLQVLLMVENPRGFTGLMAFVNLTLADSVRRGVQNLLFVTGFGSMRPNTLVLGFYEDCAPQDHLQGKMIICAGSDSGSPGAVPDQERQPSTFPSVRRAGESKDLQEEE